MSISHRHKPVVFNVQGGAFDGWYASDGRRQVLVTGAEVRFEERAPVTIHFQARPELTRTCFVEAVVRPPGDLMTEVQLRSPGTKVSAGAEDPRIWGRRR